MYSPDRVFNGTFGEVWLDNTYLSQATSLEAKWSIDKTEVNQSRVLSKGYKRTGVDGKGTLKMNKIDSTFLKLLDGEMKVGGKSKTHTLISKLDDPDAYGAERVQLTGVTFDELTLVDWELKKLGEESIPFTFTGYEVLDFVEHSEDEI